MVNNDEYAYNVLDQCRIFPCLWVVEAHFETGGVFANMINSHYTVCVLFADFLVFCLLVATSGNFVY